MATSIFPPSVSGNPAGSDTDIQFNDGGSFSGDSGLTWEKTTNALVIGNPTSDFPADVQLSIGSTISRFGLKDSGVNVGLMSVNEDTTGLPTLTALAGIGVSTSNAGDGYVVGIEGDAIIETGGNQLVAAGVVGSGTVSGTVADFYALWAEAPITFGTVTATTGVYVDAMGSSGNNRGIYINNQGSNAGDYAIFVAGGKSQVGTLQLIDGSAIRTDQTTAHTATLQAYDVDGAAYKTFATLTNGNTPSLNISQPAGAILALIPPSADPHVVGAIWNNSGTLAISAG